jgi:molecular chaperone DnaK (HSP70)
MTDDVAAIDLGTSNSKIAVFFEGKIQSVPNKIGDCSTPSIVAILNDGEAI